MGAAAAGLAAVGGVPAQEPPPASPASGSTAMPSAPPLPDPIPRELHLSRMQIARDRMALVKVTHLIEVPGPGLQYLAGLPLQRSERFTGLVLPASGPPVLICHAADRAIAMAGPVPLEEPIFYDESDEPVRALARMLKRGDASLVALSGRVWYEEFAPLHADLPKLTFAASHPFSEDQRHVKATEELRLIEAAARIVQDAVESTLREIREGMSELELAETVMARIRARGAHPEGTVVSGPRTAVPRALTGDRRIAGGDPVIVSFAARVHGYWGRVARTVLVGRATGRMRLIHQTLREAQGFGFERAKTDVPAGAVDQIMRATFGGRGFLKQVLHNSGAGCGLELSEPPFLSPGYLEKLAPGHVLTLGQGVYTGEEYGIRQQDMLVVTPDGARWLTEPAKELLEL
jgi:Xaa-Pro dipeptidase